MLPLSKNDLTGSLSPESVMSCLGKFPASEDGTTDSYGRDTAAAK